MSFFLSSLTDNNAVRPTAKFSLPMHVKIHRIWMFAMLKDRPSLAETSHIRACDACGQAFRAALGVSSLSRSSMDQQPQVNQTSTNSGSDVPKAVA